MNDGEDERVADGDQEDDDDFEPGDLLFGLCLLSGLVLLFVQIEGDELLVLERKGLRRGGKRGRKSLNTEGSFFPFSLVPSFFFEDRRRKRREEEVSLLSFSHALDAFGVKRRKRRENTT